MTSTNQQYLRDFYQNEMNDIYHDNFNILMKCCCDNKFKLFKSLYKTNIWDINAADDVGHTALIYATFHGNLKMVKFILKNGGDPNISGVLLETALFEACKYSHVKIVKELLKYGAKIYNNKLIDVTTSKSVIEILKNRFERSDRIDTCAICLEDTDEVKTPCGHIFHKECIFQVRTKCPICREQL